MRKIRMKKNYTCHACGELLAKGSDAFIASEGNSFERFFHPKCKPDEVYID